MIKYNTSEPKLKMPEYGRHIQRLVEHCVTIEDRDERTRFAYMIAGAIAKLFPSSIDENGNYRKIWDHINVISDFKLDIDFPVEVITEEEINPTPKVIPYGKSFDRFRQYGKNIVEMIHTISDMENCVEKDQLIFLVANQMKKLLVSQNPENATDIKVFNDIKEISRGAIEVDPENYRLNEYIGVVQPEGKKKKKK